MLSCIVAEELFGSFVLCVDELLHFVVNAACGFFRIGLRELLLIGIVREIGEAFSHA